MELPQPPATSFGGPLDLLWTSSTPLAPVQTLPAVQALLAAVQTLPDPVQTLPAAAGGDAEREILYVLEKFPLQEFLLAKVHPNPPKK